MSTRSSSTSLGLRVVHVARKGELASALDPHRGTEVSWDAKAIHLDESGWRDIRHAQIVLPAQYRGDDRMDWARQRSMLWKLAEYSEHEKDARVARAYISNLPASLTQEEQILLAKGFAQRIANRFGNAVDFAVHAPHPDHTAETHAHFLASAREIHLEGFGRVTLSASQHQARRINELWLDHQDQAALGAARAEAGQGAEHASRQRALANWLQLKASNDRSYTDIERETAHAPKSDHGL